MNFKEIQDLIKLINKSSLSEFKMKDGEFELTIRTDEYHKMRATPPTQQVISVPTAMSPAYAPAAPAPAAVDAAPASAAPATSDLPETTPAAEKTDHYVEVKSPIVGTFYRSPSPEKPNYVKIGDTIAVGDVVCIVEAMKLFNEIESEVSGKIVKILLEDSSPVEYDQPLFLVDPKG